MWKHRTADEEKKLQELGVEYEKTRISMSSEKDRALSETSKRYETGGTAQ
jgi:hypothetical protein